MTEAIHWLDTETHDGKNCHLNRIKKYVTIGSMIGLFLIKGIKEKIVNMEHLFWDTWNIICEGYLQVSRRRIQKWKF